MNVPFKHYARKAGPALIAIVALVAILTAYANPSNARVRGAANTASLVTALTGHVGQVKLGGTLDLRHIPQISPSLGQRPAAYRNFSYMPRLSAQQEAAYQRKARHFTALPTLPGHKLAISNAKPQYQIAPVSHNFDGINYNNSNGSGSSCGCQPPDQALAANSGFTLEGVNNALAVYNYAGVLQSGYPISYSAFYSPLLHSGDFLSDPHLMFDASAGRWVSVMDEINPGTGANPIGGYFDIAISVNGNPLGSWYYYQINSDLSNGACGSNGCWADFPQLGVDQNGLWITGVLFQNTTGSFIGNTTMVLAKDNSYFGGSAHYAYYVNIPNGTGAAAYRISPAVEIGTPQGEFEIASDDGYGGPFTDIVLVAYTGTASIASGTAPHGTYIKIPGLASYADTVSATQLGGTVPAGAGPAAVQYQGGHLLTAWGSAVNWSGDSATRDGAYWLDLTPQLSTLASANPQNVAGALVNQDNIFGYSGSYVYYPTLEASSELDEVLNFNYSNSGIGVGVAYTSRRATDSPNVMGQDNTSSFYAVSGNGLFSGSRWGDYSACSLSTYQPYVVDGVRGYVWCAGEYSNQSTAFWSTRIYSLRLE